MFLNYRTDDEPYGVLLLDKELSDRFGPDTVFLASKSIPLGDDWERAMFQAVSDSTVLLAIIGRGWLTAKKKRQRRIDLPDDFVRREILAAFELGKTVIPVRLGVPRLRKPDLPPELAPLADKQDIEIRFRSGRIDVDLLAEKLAERIPELPAPQPPPASSDDAAAGSSVVIGKKARIKRSYIAGRSNTVSYHGGPAHE